MGEGHLSPCGSPWPTGVTRKAGETACRVSRTTNIPSPPLGRFPRSHDSPRSTSERLWKTASNNPHYPTRAGAEHSLQPESGSTTSSVTIGPSQSNEKSAPDGCSGGDRPLFPKLQPLRSLRLRKPESSATRTRRGVLAFPSSDRHVPTQFPNTICNRPLQHRKNFVKRNTDSQPD